ncbi:MAG: hypothetical protein MJ126_09065 [Lachnospiraceae bacterium]|nr:hypothetical protein [Lachnospiraceae bacterium]
MSVVNAHQAAIFVKFSAWRLFIFRIWKEGLGGGGARGPYSPEGTSGASCQKPGKALFIGISRRSCAVCDDKMYM